MPTDKFWLWSFEDGKSIGPFSMAELQTKLLRREETENSKVWFSGCVDIHGEKQWKTIRDVEELQPILGELPPEYGPDGTGCQLKNKRGNSTVQAKEFANNGNDTNSSLQAPNNRGMKTHIGTSSQQSKRKLTKEDFSRFGRIFIYDGQEYLSGGAFFLRYVFFFCLALPFTWWADGDPENWGLAITLSLVFFYWFLLTYFKRIRSIGIESFWFTLFALSTWLIWNYVYFLAVNEDLRWIHPLWFRVVLLIFGLIGFALNWGAVFTNADPELPKSPLNAIRHLALANKSELEDLKNEIAFIMASFLPTEQHVFFLRKRQLPHLFRKQCSSEIDEIQGDFVACCNVNGKLTLVKNQLQRPRDGSDCTPRWKELMRGKGCTIAAIHEILR